MANLAALVVARLVVATFIASPACRLPARQLHAFVAREKAVLVGITSLEHAPHAFGEFAGMFMKFGGGRLLLGKVCAKCCVLVGLFDARGCATCRRLTCT